MTPTPPSPACNFRLITDLEAHFDSLSEDEIMGDDRMMFDLLRMLRDHRAALEEARKTLASIRDQHREGRPRPKLYEVFHDADQALHFIDSLLPTQ